MMKRAHTEFRRPIFGYPISAFCFLFSAFSTHAQDALRLSLSRETAAGERRLELENQPYTVRWGDLKVLASTSLDAEFNDNVNLVHTDPQQDFILRPMANFGVFWPVTDVNALTFSIGAGYAKFLDHSQYDQALITPGSALGWDIYLKNLRINFHDQFSYEQDPTAYGAISGTAWYGGLYNTLGTMVVWDLHDVVFSFGYDHFNFVSSSSTYDYLSRASDFLLLRAAFKVHPAATAGLELSGGPTAYDLKLLSDNVTYGVGVFAEWQVSEVIKVQPRVGYYLYSFSNEGASAGSGDQSGYYASLNISHRPSRKISYSLEAGHQAFMGNYSALTDQYYGSAYVNWRLIEHISLSTSVRYETATQPIGIYRDNYDRANANLKLSCPIKPKLIASLNYRYWIKNDALSPLLEYEQNRLTFQLAYQF